MSAAPASPLLDWLLYSANIAADGWTALRLLATCRGACSSRAAREAAESFQRLRQLRAYLQEADLSWPGFEEGEPVELALFPREQPADDRSFQDWLSLRTRRWPSCLDISILHSFSMRLERKNPAGCLEPDFRHLLQVLRRRSLAFRLAAVPVDWGAPDSDDEEDEEDCWSRPILAIALYYDGFPALLCICRLDERSFYRALLA